jgi:hypothetical protein
VQNQNQNEPTLVTKYLQNSKRHLQINSEKNLIHTEPMAVRKGCEILNVTSGKGKIGKVVNSACNKLST